MYTRVCVNSLLIGGKRLSNIQKMKKARAKRAKPVFVNVKHANLWSFLPQWSSWLLKADLASGRKHQGPVSRKSRELLGPEKPFEKVRPAYSVKLVFSYVVKGIKMKIIAKFHASRRLRFEDTKRIMSPEIHPKSFGTFQKQPPGPICSNGG